MELNIMPGGAFDEFVNYRWYELDLTWHFNIKHLSNKYYFIRKLIQGLIIFNYVRLSFGQNQFNEEEGEIIKIDIKLLKSNFIVEMF